MSVGIAAIRTDPERIRQGCIAKGEDASLVDRALAVDARRRVALAERDAIRAEANARSRKIGENLRRVAEIDRELDDLLARFETWLA